MGMGDSSPMSPAKDSGGVETMGAEAYLTAQT